MSYLDAIHVGDGMQLVSRKNPNNKADAPCAWAPPNTSSSRKIVLVIRVIVETPSCIGRAS